MRHRKAVVKLNRTSSHRSAMFKNMVTSLFKHERICTTDTKAKALRGWTDHLIGLAKRGDLHARRQALAIVHDETVIKKLFDSVQKRFGNVSGGYTRLAKAGRRPGDAAPMTIIELLDVEKAPKKKKKKVQAAPEAKAPVAPEQGKKAGAPEPKATGIPAPEAQAADSEPKAEAIPAENETAQSDSPAGAEPGKPATT